MLILKSLTCGPIATNALILFCNETRQGVIIDPAVESFARFREIMREEGIAVGSVWLTHSHWDHIGDLADIKKELGIAIHVHTADADNVRRPGSDGVPAPLPISGVEPDRELRDGEILSLGEGVVEVIHTPGHTPGSVSFYLEKEGVLISGDTLFKGSVGYLNLPTAQPEVMWNSLKKLARLPPATRVYPGHGDPTTIGEESWLDRAEEVFG